MNILFKFLIALLLIRNISTATQICGEFYSVRYNNQSAYGLQILEKYIENLKSEFNSLQSLAPKDQVDVLLKGQIRTLFFKLQSVAKVYENELKEMKVYRAFFKKFEDQLGRLDLINSLLIKAHKVENAELENYFQAELQIEATRSLRILNAENFFNGSGGSLNKVLKAVGKLSWEEVKKEKDFLTGTLIEEAKKLRDKVENKEFTNSDIELGLHELRRKLRWLLIHVQIMDGLTVYKTDIKDYDESNRLWNQLQKSNKGFENSTFLRMSDPDIKKPILIPQKAHAMISELVGQIGKEKDMLETNLYFKEAAVKLGFSKDQLEALADSVKSKLFGSAEVGEPQMAAEYFQDVITKSKLLKLYIKNIKEMNDI